MKKNQNRKYTVIELIGILLTGYEVEEEQFPFPPSEAQQAYWDGKKASLEELKNMIENNKWIEDW